MAGRSHCRLRPAPDYTFSGWYAGNTGPLPGGGSYSPLATNTTLVASWTPLPPTILTTSLPKATVGTPYHRNIVTTGGGTIVCSLTGPNLPAGLTVKGCAITGTPTTAGTNTFSITATNSSGSATARFSVHVEARATGTDPAPLALIGAILMGLGSGLTIIGRRRTV